MNNQQAFDIAAKHLLTQKRKSFTEGSECAYRGDNGLMCAIGVLIPDDVYDPDMEDTSITSLFEEFPYFSDNWSLVRVDLLQRLQQIHDNWEENQWLEQLQRTSSKYNLNSDVLKPFRSNGPTSEQKQTPK